MLVDKAKWYLFQILKDSNYNFNKPDKIKFESHHSVISKIILSNSSNRKFPVHGSDPSTQHWWFVTSLTKSKEIHYIAAERILSARDIQSTADTLHNYIAHFHEMATWLQTITVRTQEFMVAAAKTNTEVK